MKCNFQGKFGHQKLWSDRTGEKRLWKIHWASNQTGGYSFAVQFDCLMKWWICFDFLQQMTILIHFDVCSFYVRIFFLQTLHHKFKHHFSLKVPSFFFFHFFVSKNALPPNKRSKIKQCFAQPKLNSFLFPTRWRWRWRPWDVLRDVFFFLRLAETLEIGNKFLNAGFEYGCDDLYIFFHSRRSWRGMRRRSRSFPLVRSRWTATLAQTFGPAKVEMQMMVARMITCRRTSISDMFLPSQIGGCLYKHVLYSIYGCFRK